MLYNHQAFVERQRHGNTVNREKEVFRCHCVQESQME